MSPEEAALVHAARFVETLRGSDPDYWDEERVGLALESETDIFEVLHNVLRTVRNAEEMAEALKGTIAKNRSRHERYVSLATFGRDTALHMLQALGLKKKEFPEATLAVSKPSKRVRLDDPDRLPDRFVQVIRTPLKADIGAALKAGEEVPGAALEDGQPSLRITTS